MVKMIVPSCKEVARVVIAPANQEVFKTYVNSNRTTPTLLILIHWYPSYSDARL